MNTVDLSRIPIYVIFVIALCIAGIIASGKPAETFGRVLACILSYYLLTAVFSREKIASEVKFIRMGQEGIPFFDVLFRSGTSIAAMPVHDFQNFSREFMKLFLLCVVVDTMLTVFHSAVKSAEGINKYCIGLFLPWIVRYLICCGAIFVYAAFFGYVLSLLPNAVWVGLALVIVVMTGLMLLSPLIDFLILWADLMPNPFIQKVSTFIKGHKVGGVLQVSFFAAFLLLPFLTCLQEAVPDLPKYLLQL